MIENKIEKIISLFLLFFILFNFPILGIFNKNTYIMGVPMLYFFIFFTWALLSFVLFWIVEKRKKK